MSFMNLGLGMIPRTRRIQPEVGDTLKAEWRSNGDGSFFLAARLYNASGGALTANRPYMVTFGGTAVAAPNPRVTALAAVTNAPQMVVVALEATANNSWGWFAVQGEVDAGVEGTTDVAAGDFLKVDASVSTAGVIKDGTSRTKRSVAIALEAQAANSVVTTRIYLFGAGLTSDTEAVIGVLSLKDGSASAPSLTFASDTDTGIFTAAAGRLQIACNGGSTAWFEPNLLQLVDGTNIATGATTGMKIGTNVAQKIGFWNVTPVAQPSAFTQTYATGDKTHANPTATTVTNAFGTADGTYEDTSGTSAAIANNFQESAAQINSLIADVADVKQLVNSVIDDLQSMGLLA